MFRIGIIGSDNSHAEIFSKLVNIPDEKTGAYAYPDMRVTAIFGLDKTRTEEVAAHGKIEMIAQRPEELLNQVDAAMVVFRHGDLHLPYALPFIEAGIPVWLDKPFTITNQDVQKLKSAAIAHGTLITGGSTCKYTPDVLNLRSVVTQENRIGSLRAAAVNFPATLANEYGGIYFYGAHLVEMALAIFGYQPRSVTANENNGGVVALVNYDQFQVALNFLPDTTPYGAILYGHKGTMSKEIDISGCYRYGFAQFAEMLRTGKSPTSFEQIETPVKLLNAIKESYETKRAVIL
ncbi:MAG: Gfo/Idh/MocA family oxidoreductase [Clostridiaceae bacterium]|nr:Gfo/Idh/MocA family oxidoreductase [Clostridiaceae bacterium]